MLEKPNIADARISACLKDAYGLSVARVVFLPLGADQQTAVYHALADDGAAYFVKLRSGAFDPLTLIVPHLLRQQGIEHVIAPLAAQSGQLWTPLDDFKLALFPFIDGQDAYQVAMADVHWLTLGRALKAIHVAGIPAHVRAQIRQEDYADNWRVIVRRFVALAEDDRTHDPVTSQLAAFLRAKRDTITKLVERAESLAAILRGRQARLVLCHGDIHAGNVLIGASGAFYLVDWDTLILAPKERDLMFVGGGLFMNMRTPEQEETLFYQGYGETDIDPVALAYYRYERIVQDIAAFGEQILLSEDGGDDRELGLRLLLSQFLPGQVVEIAFRSEARLPPEYRVE